MVLVKESFLNTTHGQLGCTACHLGDSKAIDKQTAHIGLVAMPSDSVDVYCGGCHAGTMAKHRTSLHANVEGYFTLIEKRSGVDIRQDPSIRPKFDQECGKCHASCGQCHITRPISVGGGFVNGHNFKKSPDNTLQCTACHGSRVGAEYKGENEGLKSDVHWIPNVMKCEACHTGAAMHASSVDADHRYHDDDLVQCEECHDKGEDNVFHNTHWGGLACQVCHSQPYKNCNGCHTGGAGITGSSYIDFKIAKNPKQSDRRPYKIAVVRHIPIARDTYADWGLDLPHYDSEPTWKYASPHNILLKTAQTDTTGGKRCGASCHGSDLYLTLDDLQTHYPDEVEANKNIVLEK